MNQNQAGQLPNQLQIAVVVLQIYQGRMPALGHEVQLHQMACTVMANAMIAAGQAAAVNESNQVGPPPMQAAPGPQPGPEPVPETASRPPDYAGRFAVAYRANGDGQTIFLAENADPPYTANTEEASIYESFDVAYNSGIVYNRVSMAHGGAHVFDISDRKLTPVIPPSPEEESGPQVDESSATVTKYRIRYNPTESSMPPRWVKLVQGSPVHVPADKADTWLLYHECEAALTVQIGAKAPKGYGPPQIEEIVVPKTP